MVAIAGVSETWGVGALGISIFHGPCITAVHEPGSPDHLWPQNIGGVVARLGTLAKRAYGKRLSGRYAETVQFGASTTSLILRSTAAEQRI